MYSRLDADGIAYPNHLFDYYRTNTDKFIEKRRWILTIFLVLIMLACGVLLYKPEYANQVLHMIVEAMKWPSSYTIGSLMSVRIGAVVVLIVTIFSLWGNGTGFYNKNSGGRIKDSGIGVTFTEDDDVIIDLAEKHQFDKIAKATHTDETGEGDICLIVHEDPKGKEFYVLVAEAQGTMFFQGIAPVMTIVEPEYSKYKKSLRSFM